MSAPLVVVRSGDVATPIVRRLSRDGWTVRRGFVLPAQPWHLGVLRLVLTGHVLGAAETAAAVLAAARGAGLVVVADTSVALALHADLARIGFVSWDMLPPPPAPTDGLPINDEQRALLARLAAGESIGAAAAAEFLSLRTANRRLREARAALGVRTTREAVLAFVQRRRAA